MTLDAYSYQTLLVNVAFALGNVAQAFGILLVARYVYAFFFHDEFDPSDQVVAHAKLGFALLVLGFCLVNLFAALSLVVHLLRRF